jgi:flagellar M-ring protein FliF
MFDAAYWRAKEGELARTLLATPGITQARVHIGAPRRRSFSNERAVPTASVTLTGTGGPVPRSSAMSARYLVSLAVPGLAAEQVAVIDSSAGVLLRPGDDAGTPGSFGDSERAQKMKAEIATILAARVGDGRARVSVNIETTRESETISLRSIDPDSKSLRESKTTEVAQTGKDKNGATTVASNLPEGDAAGGESSSSRDETRRTDVFDYTETRKEVLRPAGTIKRISVAVLLDEIRTVGPDGDVTAEARTREELRKLENLVKSAIGFDEERGDLVTVESISFADVPQSGTLATPGEAPSFFEQNMMKLIQIGVLVLVVLILGLFVVRPVLMAGYRSEAARVEEEDAAMSAIDITPDPATDAAQEQARANGADGDPASAGQVQAKPNALELLRDAVDSRNDESVDVIRGWLEDGSAMEAAR